MLRNTFVHLPGVGPKRERAFWEQGILDWDGFLAHTGGGRLKERAGDSTVALVQQSVDAGPSRRRLLQAAPAAQ